MRARLNQRFENALEHSLRSLQHLIVPEPNHTKAAASETTRALQIFDQRFGMLTSIEFNDQPRT